ncbi:phosphotransferase [Streptomyces sp. SID5643]|uniref:phosphotransferase family protein n=1 Tax=Streptomyces sp. SID5643 TaxID=2690307 RepID=UPI00136D8E95|nr:phosphotransferase [Streptomyces sp. SID5643]MZF90952.1 phosphotransferase [Streptomyces sp. SID5643]
MPLAAELRGLLPLRPAGALTRPADVLTARRLADSLHADGVALGQPAGARRTFSDLLVFRLSGDGVPAMLVKHPRSSRAIESLARECDVVRSLAGDERLGAWRRLLPSIERCRLEEPLPLLVESALPGVEGDALLRRSPHLAHPVAASALATIRALHRATGRTQEVTELASDWVRPRLAALADEVRWCREGGGADALLVLRQLLERELAGRRLLVAWTHGDFHPGNVLLTGRQGALSGVIDWAGALPDGPSELDCLTFVLTLRHRLGGRQLGRIVADAVRVGALPPADRRLLAEAGALAPDAPGETALTLLTWLWHVAGNVTKSARYGRSRRWIAQNVVPVLTEVAAREAADTRDARHFHPT